MAERLRVEVVHALPGRTLRRLVEVAPGTTVAEALQASGIAAELPGVALHSMPVGCFGRRVEATAPVSDGDRLELYRPLLVDPREARRRRRRR